MVISCDVRDLRANLAGLTLKQAAAMCGVSVRTVQRWQAAEACPVWFHALCTALAGDLSRHGWDGWRVVRGLLVSPGGDLFRPGQLLGLRWTYGELQELRKLTRPGAQLALDLAISEYRPSDTDQPARRRGSLPLP